MQIHLKQEKYSPMFHSGTSQEHMFKVYRNKRASDICKCLEDLLLLKPDGDLIPNEVNIKHFKLESNTSINIKAVHHYKHIT